MDRVGQQLGNYRLTRLLGQGGFADVYLSEHVHLGIQAAIKVLQGRMSAQDLQDFTKEARTIAGLKHPRILRVLDFGIEGTTPFLVMDYAPKGTLRDRHPGGTPLSVSTILPYVQQVAAALQYAHDQKFVHRDVKPENMLVDVNDTILLSDFGIAIAAHKSQSLSTQDAIGTVTYMAPEQIKGKARPASDQYSLAVVVYEWLCGTVPFDGSTSIEIAMSHLTDPPPPLRGKVPTISPTVEQIVLQALAKDWHQRFACVQEFAEALEKASSSQQVSHPKPTWPMPSPPPPIIPTPPPRLTPPVPIPTPAPVPRKRIPHTPARRRISRRFVITTGAVVAGAVAVGKTFPLISSFFASRALYTYRGHNGPVTSVAWSPDGKYIASGDEGNGTSEPILWWYTLQVWDASTGRQMFTDRIDGNVTAVAWSPDGKRIASASGSRVGFQGRNPITNSQGATLGYSDNSIQVWDATTGAIVYIHDNNNYSVSAMVWSPDGKYIASTTERVSNNQQDSVPGVQVWDATSGKDVYIYRGHFDSEFSQFSALAWSPNSQRIASSFSYSDASNNVDEYAVQVWEALTGTHVYTYTGHSAFVNALAWSRDGKYIASGSSDYTVQVWDSTSGRHIYTYQGHSGSVEAVAWSPDGKRIVSGSSDGTAQEWDALTGKNAYTYRGHADYYWDHFTSGAPVNAVAWSPDGKLIASGSNDKTVQVWRSQGS